MSDKDDLLNKKGFKEAVLSFTVPQAIMEASRCILCYEPPCTEGCPAGIDVGKFIRQIRFKNFAGAARTIRADNPLGGICARVCPTEQLCMEACCNSKLDCPIEIGRLQRFVTDLELRGEIEPVILAQTRLPQKVEKVAVIGAGPAGLSCTLNLWQMGYQVTIFEKRKFPGGILAWGIPGYRLPKRVVQAEISHLKKLGIKFVTGKKLGPAFNFAVLQKQGFKAVFLAMGLSKAHTIGLPGEKLKGVHTAVDFLYDAKTSGGNRKKMKIKTGKNVVVIGGGNVAMDAACTASRLGAERVDLVCLESYEEMPAFRSEIVFAQKSGIEFHTRCKPLKITGAKGKATALKGIRIRWRKPGLLTPSNAVKIHGTEFTLPADTVIQAIGLGPDPEIKKIFPGIKTGGSGLVIANKKTGMTNIKGVFAGGDIVNGGDTVVQAVAEGRLAALGIDKYLGKTRK